MIDLYSTIINYKSTKLGQTIFNVFVNSILSSNTRIVQGHNYSKFREE